MTKTAKEMEEAAALHRHRLRLLGSKLMAKLPFFHWEFDVTAGLWLLRDESEREAMRLSDRGLEGWRGFFGEPDLVPILHDCEEWVGFTLD